MMAISCDKLLMMVIYSPGIPHSTCQIMWALAVLDVDPGRQWTAALSRCLSSSLHELPHRGRELDNAAWGMAHIRSSSGSGGGGDGQFMDIDVDAAIARQLRSPQEAGKEAVTAGSSAAAAHVVAEDDGAAHVVAEDDDAAGLRGVSLWAASALGYPLAQQLHAQQQQH
jgi:hypothetical protein